MTQFNRAVFYFAGSTGLQIAGLLEEAGLRPHPCQPRVYLESRPSAPPRVPARATYISLSQRLDTLAPRRQACDALPQVVRDLPAIFYQDTDGGGGQEPGVMAVSVAFHATVIAVERRSALNAANGLYLEEDNADLGGRAPAYDLSSLFALEDNAHE